VVKKYKGLGGPFSALQEVTTELEKKILEMMGRRSFWCS
jgi:hypothetical protein